MITTHVFRAINVVRVIGPGLCRVRSSLLLAMCNIVWVSAGHGASTALVANPDKTVAYTGKAMSVVEP